MRRVSWSVVALGVLLLAPAARAGAVPVTVGSKAFTEGVILGEIATQAMQRAGVAASHRAQLGGTRILWRALTRGDIAVYAEYTGTLREEIFAAEKPGTARDLAPLLARHDLAMTAPLGFDDTYAIGMRERVADSLGIRTIGDLVRHPTLRCGFSNEFLDRGDGWPGLRAAYQLPQRRVRGLDHELAYRGLVAHSVDVTDLYSTDAEIRQYGLRVLRDDRHYFPQYQAVLLYRRSLDPRGVRALHALAGAIDVETMRAMNARAKLDHVPEAQLATEFLQRASGVVASTPQTESVTHRIARQTLEHLALVGGSLAGALVVGLPLGVLCARRRRLGQFVLSATGIVQTIPSLALLVLLLPLLGIGSRPAVVALFLYSLLPIVRNTTTGLRGIAPSLREAAEALGLTARQQLWRIELPLASPMILAGIKTAAVINVGTATIGALIGAGGYGQAILTGIRLDDHALILQGAIPAAALALLVQLTCDGVDHLLVPRGLRLPRGGEGA